jgi:TonB family protein
MVTRNAYIASGALHLLMLGLLLVFASSPPSKLESLVNYRPVRLVVQPGRPGPVVKEKPAEQTRKEETPVKSEPKEKSKDKPKTKAESTEKSFAQSKEQTEAIEKPEPKTASSSTEAAGEGGEGGVRLDGAAHFPYPYYLSSIQIKILSNFKPVISAKQAKGLKAVVFFVINRNGKISDVKLENKSGHFLFDQEAQRAVLISSPFPALPPAFGSERLGVHFEFVASQ